MPLLQGTAKSRISSVSIGVRKLELLGYPFPLCQQNLKSNILRVPSFWVRKKLNADQVFDREKEKSQCTDLLFVLAPV